MKRHILILAACACACAFAGVMSARLGALGRNDTVVTNVTDVTPGNYETVSNSAMSARGKTDLEVYAAETTPWTCSEVFASGEYAAMTNLPLWTFKIFDDVEGRQKYPEIWYNGTYIGGCNSPMAYDDLPTATEWHMFYDLDLYVTFRRHIAGMATGNRLATTNDIPRTPGAVGAYPAASGSALESGKQDRLPYLTNAIPFSVIVGAPSGGGQEWRVVNYDVEIDGISFVTNGMANLMFLGGDIGVSVITNGWPDGASMFARGQFSAETSYTLGSNVRLVGYGTWPTNNFQSVWWRSGTNIYVNVILEE